MSIRSSLFFSLLERYTGFAIQFVSTIVLSRLLTPHEIGVYSVSAALLAFCYVIREFGIPAFLIQDRNLTEQKIRTAFGLMILMSWPLAFVTWLSRDLIAQFYGNPEIASVIAVMAINFVVLPFGQPARGLLNRAMRFKALTMIDVVSAGTHAAAAVMFALHGHGPMSLAYASVIGTATTVIMTLGFEPQHIRLMPALANWREMLAFGSYSTAASIVSTAGANSAELIIGKALDLNSVGLYSRAVGLVGLLQSHLPSALVRVALPGFAQMLRSGQKLENSYLVALAHVTGLLWPAYAVLALNAEPIINLLFGSQWLSAAPVAKILCLGGAINGLVFLIHSVYGAYGAMSRRFRGECAVQSFRIIATVVAAPYGLLAVASVYVLTITCAGITFYFLIRDYFRITFDGLAKAVWRSGVVTLMTGACVLGFWFVTEIPPDQPFFRLASAAVVGGAGWVIGISLMQHVLYHEIRRLIKSSYSLLFIRSAE